MTGPLSRIVASIVRLWNTRDHLQLRNLRPSHLPYTLAMPMGLGIGNMMSSLFRVNAPLFGLDPKVTLYCAYLLGACAFFPVSSKHFAPFSRIMAALASVAIAAWLLLPWGMSQSAAATLCWFGLGGCVFCGTYAYMLVLNNTERFFGAVLIVVNYGLCLLLDAAGAAAGQLWKVLPVGFLLATVVCIAQFKPRELDESFARSVRKLDRTMYPAFALFFVFFLMDAFISFLYVRGGQASILFFGLGATLGGLLSVLVQFIFKRSIWHVWNLYFILLALSFALMQVDPGATLYLVGSFLCGLCTIGYAASFYTFGGVMRKYGSYVVFKKYMCGACLPPLIITFVLTGILNAHSPDFIPRVSLAIACAFLVLYILFSPLFQKHLFTAGWFDDYRKPDMTALAAQIEQTDQTGLYRLTSREKEVCSLLLAGYSRKQIGIELHISYATVGFHCTSLYKKLQINSLSELFAMFGYQEIVADRQL
ncbi:MAG: helix-turn-helix transcriptional regulator [Clostridiales bacterium]|nr:helix-turn-helix transcriptional regulator [Clostridiales bacterium]